MFEYRLIRSGRRTVGLEIKDGSLLVRAPRRLPLSEIEKAIRSHRAWIEKQLAAASERAGSAEPPFTAGEISELTEMAKEFFPRRARYYAPIIGVEYRNITVRCQKTKWGSCSAKGNLSFNCLLMLAPPDVADAVVVHELCHLKYMDHSPAFYAEVERVMPDYRECGRWLKENGRALLARVRK